MLAHDTYNSQKYNDMYTELKTKKKETEKSYDASKFNDEIKILKEAFPPCINCALNGMNDGRKRGLFVLLKFLSKSNYSFDEIEKMVYEWNAKNTEPLRETYLRGQLYQLKKNKAILPPNCVNEVYKEINICKPDKLCERIKNPLNYASRKHFFLTRVNEEKEKEELKKKKKEKIKNTKSKIPAEQQNIGPKIE